MLKALGRAVVIAVVGVVFGLGGVVGDSVAQDTMKKDDTMKLDDKMKTGEKMQTGDKMKSGDTMMKGEKKGDMKADEMKKDDKMMEKKQ